MASTSRLSNSEVKRERERGGGERERERGRGREKGRYSQKSALS